jgi:hypothetical protein
MIRVADISPPPSLHCHEHQQVKTSENPKSHLSFLLFASDNLELRLASDSKGLGYTDHKSNDDAAQEKGCDYPNGRQHNPQCDLQDDHGSQFLGLLTLVLRHMKPRLGIVEEKSFQVLVYSMSLGGCKRKVARPERVTLGPHRENQHRAAIFLTRCHGEVLGYVNVH